MKENTRRVEAADRKTVSIIELAGRLTGDGGDAIVRNALHRELARQSKIIVFDMKHVTYVDSVGLIELVNAYNTSRLKGVELVFTSVGSKIQVLFQVTQLTVVFQVFEDTECFLRSASSHSLMG